MKKVVSIIVFVIICILVFVVSLFIGFKLAYNRLLNERYGHLKVNFTEDIGTVTKDLSYGSHELQKYDLYLPADKSKENYSLILYVHGGGFTGGDKGSIDAERYGEYLASKGYIVVSANYRLAGKEEVSVKEMYEDLLVAIDTSIKEADSRGYHINEMATTGGSAGGCLAMLVAYKEPEKLPVPIKLVFEETGPASFEPDLWDMKNDDERAYFVNSVANTNFTAKDVGSEEYQKAIDEISVATMINEESVPILLAYGPNDKMVSVKAKYPLLDALKENNVEHTYIEFPHSGHGLSADLDKTKEYFEVMTEYLNKYLANN